MDEAVSFDHIHLVSEDAPAAARWYVDILGAEIKGEAILREAPQISVRLGGMTLLIRGKRPGETPGATAPMQDYGNYSSHNHWGTDHFGYTYRGDLIEYSKVLKAKGATFAVEPWEFSPGGWLCYLAAPDGVSIEIVQARNPG